MMDTQVDKNRIGIYGFIACACTTSLFQALDTTFQNIDF